MSRLLSTLLSVALIGVAAWLVFNRQQAVDWWRLSQYTPTAEVERLVNNSTMHGRGRDLFYASDPKVQDGAHFNASCSQAGEQTIVLGCYKAQQIFLYNVADPRLDGVKEVTAAHEMLHAAYDRMDRSEQQRIDTLLKPIIDGMQDERILGLITLYNQHEPGELYNEMHSILGTEYADLTPQLEDYYKQYFTDRHKIVGYAQKYQAVFTESKQKLDHYDQQLSKLKTQIDQANASLQQQQSQLQAENQQLNQLRSSGQVQAYNQAVPAYNAKVRDFNTLVAQTRQYVEEYNALVVERNQQAAAQNNLYQSLDSRYQPVQQH